MKKYVAFVLAFLMLIAAGCILPAAAAEEPTAPSNSSMTMGTIENKVYTNTYAGITFDLSGGWFAYNVEQLQDLPENLSELFADTEFADQLPNVIIDMQAENAELLISANVYFTKLSLSERLAAAAMTDEELIQLTLDQKDAILAAYAQAGMEASGMEMVYVNYLGARRPAIRTIASVQDVPYYQLQILDYRLGSYMMTITAASIVKDNTQQVLDLFAPLPADKAA